MKFSEEHSTVYKNLPIPIKFILNLTEGWLVGGSIDNLIKGKPPKDYDIVVPNREKFALAVQHLDSLNKGFSVNSYGGIKSNAYGVELDIWCEELSHFLTATKGTDYIYNYNRNLLFKLS